MGTVYLRAGQEVFVSHILQMPYFNGVAQADSEYAPLRSHNAMSMPDRALMITGPPR
jgi:hypothetical protein